MRWRSRPALWPGPELLDALPVTGPDLARVSDERARALFDAFRLEVTYDKQTHRPVPGDLSPARRSSSQSGK